MLGRDIGLCARGKVLQSDQVKQVLEEAENKVDHFGRATGATY